MRALRRLVRRVLIVLSLLATAAPIAAHNAPIYATNGADRALNEPIRAAAVARGALNPAYFARMLRTGGPILGGSPDPYMFFVVWPNGQCDPNVRGGTLVEILGTLYESALDNQAFAPSALLIVSARYDWKPIFEACIGH